jgi:hypothetical protein
MSSLSAAYCTLDCAIYTYNCTHIRTKVRVKVAKVRSKMQPKVVVLLPFIVTFESKVCQNPHKNTQEGKV